MCASSSRLVCVFFREGASCFLVEFGCSTYDVSGLLPHRDSAHSMRDHGLLDSPVVDVRKTTIIPVINSG